MPTLGSRIHSYVAFKGRSFASKIVPVVSALLLLSFLVEFLILRYYDRNWDLIVEQQAIDNLDRATTAFIGVQRETRRVAAEVALHPVILASLSESGGNRNEVFEAVSRIAREQNIGIEVYNTQAQLIAWDGSSEPSHQREIQIALAGQLASFVTRAQVFSQLFVVMPVRSQGAIIGAILVRRTTELNYPLSNKLIVSRGLAEQLTGDLGVEVEYNFSTNAAFRKDGRYISAPLIGIDSSKVGVVSVARPSRGAYLESIANTFHSWNAVLWIALLATACVTLGTRLATIQTVAARSLAITALIWVVRYALIWLDLPSTVVHISIFDPTYFASTFGNGLAKSIGDLFFTTVALFVNTVLVGRYILSKDNGTTPWWYPNRAVFRWFLVPVITTLVFLFLRGYAATVRSAVYDSTLRFNDPTVIVPSFELAVMVMSLFLLSFCLIGVVVALASFAYALLAGMSSAAKASSWFVVVAAFVLTAGVIEIIPSDPLVPLLYRLLFAAGILCLAYYLHRQRIHQRHIATVRNLLLVFGLSAVFFFPVLDGNVHDRDRDKIEAYALDVIRPADSWLKFILDEALEGFRTGETVNTLTSGDEDDFDRIAFDHWAGSTAAREGYSCVFAVSDSSGYEVSRFMIGGQATLEMYHRLLNDRPKAKLIVVERNGTGVNAIRVYSGSIPITGDDGRVLGYGHVVIAAGQQALFRGESPSVLRNESEETIEAFYRPIAVSEFHDNRLLTSNNMLLPIGYEVPAAARTQLADPQRASVWVDERIDNTSYETFYIKRPTALGEIVSLSVPQLGFVWHLISILKMFVYYAIVVLVFGIGIFIVQWLRGYRYEFTFRDKLLGALLVTALLPLIVLATTGRQLAKDRMLETIGKRLEQETATLAVSIGQRLQGEEGIVQEALSRYVIDQLANEAGADFNLYVGNQLQASSRPELYEVGILDKRLSGLAFSNTMLKGKRFYLQTETIGTYQYVVGYRTLVSGDGRIAGIVAVPTLYRFEEVEAELSRRNALIFGLYAVVFIIIVVIATTFANRIAAPIHKLTLATKRVARGDANVTVGIRKADGEIGELIRSFEMMTHELARSREELVHVERELAWKEMAKQVAHEIKNPLTPMKLSMQHLRQTYKDKVANFEQVFDEVSRTMIEQIDTLSRIAGEFARFARMPKANLESVDVNAALRESVSLFDQDVNVKFEMLLDDHLPSVRSDKEELRRAFINILRNGIQAMNNSGKMTIRSWQEGGNVCLAFSDHGIGMSDEVKAKLFQPNFSTKTDGMGLGLAITKKSIDDMGGSIAIQSTVGEGTTVTIVLPVEHRQNSPRS